MNKLHVHENKKLVLKNIILYPLRNFSLDGLHGEMTNFINRIKQYKVQTFGPLIIKNCGSKIQENGEITVDYDLMFQAHDFKLHQNEFEIYDKLIVEHCLYLQFEDSPQYSNFATSKLELYMYENNLHGNGTLYTLILDESENHLKMDLFVPVITQ